LIILSIGISVDLLIVGFVNVFVTCIFHSQTFKIFASIFLFHDYFPGDSVDVEELRNALSIIRQRRHAAAQKQRPDFLENVEPKGWCFDFEKKKKKTSIC